MIIFVFLTYGYFDEIGGEKKRISRIFQIPFRTTVKRRNKTGIRKWYTYDEQFKFRERRLLRQLKMGCKSSTK